MERFFEPARTFAEAEDGYRQVLAPHLLSADFMKNRDRYAGVEMKDAARYLLSQDQVEWGFDFTGHGVEKTSRTKSNA